ncbi:MAG: hypothetical protein NZM16_01630 [Thermoflexus sp.]|uniref:hypothetical protein n=1 Tax=Thermoflexus sp. TaxID=1969742 RepID=UPI0025CFC4AA|nr:hypothetical protein [Thermoflexus sp.]MCS6962736.1 hypothetical protein [Thermoflexus sp.]MCS7351428.1 hypothetical protein [Thermoflexus sp.]MDW8180885.1 hypothetical protein [Anaerolineae bacterium]MDW8184054.1 hypothetical protein [Anaerolineae bacterium]
MGELCSAHYKSLLKIRRRAARRDAIALSVLIGIIWAAGLLSGAVGESRGLFMVAMLMLIGGLGLSRALRRMDLLDQALEWMEGIERSANHRGGQ